MKRSAINPFKTNAIFDTVKSGRSIVYIEGTQVFFNLGQKIFFICFSGHFF